MKKIFFVVLVLLSCCTFLSAKKTKIKVPEGLKTEFDSKGEWCFFTIPKSGANRLAYFDKNKYKLFKEGDLLKKVSYEDKYYARDLSKKIYKPYWGMEKDFSTHLVSAKQYINSLDNKIKSSKATIKDLKQKIADGEVKLDYNKERYNHYKSYKKYRSYSNNYRSVIKSKLKYYKKTLKQQKSVMKKLTGNLRRSKTKLQDTLKFKTKTETLYKKYVIAKK